MARPPIIEEKNTRLDHFRSTGRHGKGGPGLLPLKEPGQVQSQVPKAPDLQQLPAGKVAIAQPDTAPYGLAAQQALQRSGQLPALQPRLVYAQDIGQTFQFVSSHNAPSGFVALSQLLAAHTPTSEYRQLDASLYAPLVQKRVVLASAERRAAAERFASYFDTQQATLRAAGYALPSEDNCAAD